MISDQLSKALIVDLDGTLCNVSHRLHYVQKPRLEKRETSNFEWQQWNLGCEHDLVNLWCLEIIKRFQSTHKIIVITGRPEGEYSNLATGSEVSTLYYKMTETWLKKYQVPYDALYMKKTMHHKDDELFKKQIYETHVKPYFNVEFALEDRPSVCRMWRKNQIVCLQVDDVEF